MFQRIPYWVQNYGNAGLPDSKAVEIFMECETKEMVSMLRNELIGLSQGVIQVAEETLDQMVGMKRKIKHGSYPEWAKLMLLWMASYKG